MITINVSGNICADAIVNNVNGTDVVKFSVASNRRYKTHSGEIKEESTFIYCHLWNNKEAAKLLYKGRAVALTGFLQVRNYVGNDGVLRTAVNVRVSSFQVFGKKKKENTSEQQHPQFSNNYPETEKPPVADIVDDLPF